MRISQKQQHKAKYVLLENKILNNAAVVVENGIIVDVAESVESENCLDHGNALITPGLVNLHTHLQYTDLDPFESDSVNFIDWISCLIGQYAFWSKSKKIKSFKKGLKEAVLSGTTCISQLSVEEDFLELFNDFNIQVFFFLETFSNSKEKSEKEFEKLLKRYGALKAQKPFNVELGFSPHSLYNVHPDLWQKIAQYAAKNNILVHTHLAESQAESDWLQGVGKEVESFHKKVFWKPLMPYLTGLDPVEYLEKLSVLELLQDKLIAAHLVQLNRAQIERLLSFNVKVAHCPRSNMFLNKKTIDLNNLDKKILGNVGVGTDSKFSNHDLSMLKEALFIKNNSDLDFLTIMNMITVNSARILKLDNRKGSIKRGKDADFLVFNLNQGEIYEDILLKKGPDKIFLHGELIAENGKFTSEKWQELNEF